MKNLFFPFLFIKEYLFHAKSETKKQPLSFLYTLAFTLVLIYPSSIKAADAYDASLAITVSPAASVNAGEDLNYTVTVKSESLKIESDIEITNLFDVDFTYVSVTGGDWSCLKSGQAVICTSGSNINNNADSTFTFTISPTANGTTTSITNDANITAVGNTDPDTDYSNNTATVTTIVNPVADLSIMKTSSASAVSTNAPFSYELVIVNNGPYQSENITVTDTLPSGVIYNGSSDAGCTFSLGTITCTGVTLAVGNSHTITMNVFAPNTAATIINTASVTSDTFDFSSTNNQSSVSVDVQDISVDLSIIKTATPNPVLTASPLVYTIDVTNIGIDDATGVQVVDELDPSLLFASIDGGTDWSCGQGQYIVCDYIGTGGILTSGSSTASITLTVTTPAQDATVPNTATVTSDSVDSNLLNNASTVSVTVNSGTNQGGSTPLSKYLQYNLFGDMKLIGNANVNFSGTDPNENYNDRVDMKYVDTDGISATYNSSSSTLNLSNPLYKILWVGLYWEGHICSSDSDGDGDGDGTGCDWSNSPYSSFNDANANLGTVKLKTPHESSYIDITANSLNIIQQSSVDWTYSAFADITHLIDEDETGTYSVADIVLTEGEIGGGGNYGGWSVLVVYEDPSSTLHYKNISIFNGFQYINSDDNSVDIDGFITPRSGPVTASIAFFAADGDPSLGGVGRMRNGNTTTYSAIGDPVNPIANPTDNLFNSTIAEFGVPINSGVTKTYGVDADRVDVSSFMINSQTDTEFLFDVSTPSGGVDYYSLSMFSFITDLTTPIINNFDKSATILYPDGSTAVSGPGVAIYPNSEMIYQIKFKNTGDEVATLVEIFDDFDFDGLTQALNLTNFDASKIKLSNVNATTWQSNPDCGFDAGDNRVWCRIPEVNIDEEYIMEFSVTVSDDFTSIVDSNATNVAYINYKNATTDDFVFLVTNIHGSFGGASNSFNGGVFISPGTFTTDFITLDAINANYDFDTDKNITTKIANSPFSIKLVHVDRDGANTGYQAWEGTRPMNVILSLCEGDTATILNDPATTVFTQGMTELVVDNINLTTVHRNDRIRMAYVDWATALQWPDSNSPCVNNSNDSANLNGVPQCFNSWLQAETVFNEESFPYVSQVCYGNDPSFPNGSDSACDSQAYSNNGDTASGNIYPPQYNHSYGCLSCLTDAFNEFNRCSTDNFSVRPDKFELISTDPAYPDLLRSGQEYNLSIEAKDALDQITLDYNQTNAKNILDINKTLYFRNNVEDTSALLYGTATLGNSAYSIPAGISIAPGTTSNEVVGYTFDDVGKVSVRIEDPDWAQVDNDDTPQDCTTNTWNGIQIEAPTFICGELNTTFIPDYFKVDNVHLNNHAQTTFTYLANDLNMSAHIDVTISAMNALGGITQNFRQDDGAYQYYENPLSLDLNISKDHPLLNAKIKNDIPNPILLGFGGTDANGTHTIPWDENDTAQQIMFNYVRNLNEVVEPFEVNGTDINISVQSIYSTSAGTAFIVGDGIADRNATFYYAKIDSREFFYEDVTTISKITPIDIRVYCALTIAECNLLGIDTSFVTDDDDWYLAVNHQQPRGDGDIALKVQASPLIEGAGSPTINTITNPNGASVIVDSSGGVNNLVTVAIGTGASLPMTLGIEIVQAGDTFAPPSTDEWLVYNKDDPILYPDPFYKVRFLGPEADWAGVGKTGHAMDVNLSNTTTNRMDW